MKGEDRVVDAIDAAESEPDSELDEMFEHVRGDLRAFRNNASISTVSVNDTAAKNCSTSERLERIGRREGDINHAWTLPPSS